MNATYFCNAGVQLLFVWRWSDYIEGLMYFFFAGANSMHYFSKAIFVLVLGVSTVFCADVHEKPATNPVSGTIDWIYDYATGQTLSRSTGKPMFVVFRCER